MFQELVVPSGRNLEEDPLPRRQARLSSKGLAVGHRGQSVVDGIKIHAGALRGELTDFVPEPKMERIS